MKTSETGDYVTSLTKELIKLGIPEEDVGTIIKELKNNLAPVPLQEQVVLDDLTKNVGVKNYLSVLKDIIYRLPSGLEEAMELLKWHIITKATYEDQEAAFSTQRNLMVTDYISSNNSEHKRKVLLFIIFSFSMTAEYVQQEIQLIQQ